jgi:hypothetical protein
LRAWRAERAARPPATGADQLTILLDAEIARLQQARGYLDGALLCRYDHPATECHIMGQEIDRRLGLPATDPN